MSAINASIIRQTPATLSARIAAHPAVTNRRSSGREKSLDQMILLVGALAAIALFAGVYGLAASLGLDAENLALLSTYP
jgi:hypothetical protein